MLCSHKDILGNKSNRKLFPESSGEESQENRQKKRKEKKTGKHIIRQAEKKELKCLQEAQRRDDDLDTGGQGRRHRESSA